LIPGGDLVESFTKILTSGTLLGISKTYLRRVSMFGRNKIAMLVAEFLGTGVLTLVVLSVQRSTIGIPYFVALAGGLAVAALTLVFTNSSGAHFNPALTLGMWTARKVRTIPAATYIVSQLLGGWAAYGVYTYFVNNSLQPIGGHFTARIMIAEAVGMFIFAFLWAAVAAQRLAYSFVGAAFALGVIVAAAASIGFINPAVALGARAWELWGSMGWGTYLLGPVIGSVVGFNLYQLLFEGTTFRPGRVTVASEKAVAERPAAVETTKPRSAAAKVVNKKTAVKKRK
jgi:glycerol uptake facilitator-like aquaporin